MPKCARHGVLFTPSHTRESLLPISELVFFFFLKNALTTLAILEMATMTRNTTTKEVEDGHHIQPELGSTDHATHCPALLVA